jgi:hypothetical protein
MLAAPGITLSIVRLEQPRSITPQSPAPIDVATGTVTKPGGGETFTATDIFTNAQIFDVGSGTNLFQSIGTGDYTFTGQGTNNTLDYSADADGVTINLASDTVTKDLDFIIIADPLLKLQKSLEQAGIHFREEDGGDIGVILRSKSQ